MHLADPVVVPILDASRVGEARRAAITVARHNEFTDSEQSRVALVATEMATNLLKFATEGELLLRSLVEGCSASLELLAVDRGPGIARISDCLRDGFSTAGTPGNGFGSILRQSDTFDIISTVGSGTVCLSRILRAAAESVGKPAPDLQIGAICRPVPTEEVCGDGWAVEQVGDRSVFLVVDGLGHGPGAQLAAVSAIRMFRKHAAQPLEELLGFIHGELRGTRGAAVALAAIHPAQRELRFVGIGNISGILMEGTERRSLVSQNGTVGHEVRRIQEFVYPWAPESLLVLHSDGLGTQWNLERYPGLAMKHRSLLAGVLYRDFWRRRDDVTVLAIGEQR